MPFPNIGPGELILILVIALVVLGPGKLPDVAASLGKSLREFRKAASDVSDAAKVDAPAPGARGDRAGGPGSRRTGARPVGARRRQHALGRGRAEHAAGRRSHLRFEPLLARAAPAASPSARR